jgi:hypothetical protein
MKQYIPNSITLALESPSDELQQLMSSNIFPLFKGKQIDIAHNENFMECVYICKDFTCSLPMYSLAELKKYLDSN